MWKVLTAVIVMLIAGLVWAGSQLVWPQHDYAAEGVCTAAQIDRTYAVLADLREFQSASIGRVNYEASLIQPRVRTLWSVVLRAVNGNIDLRFARHHTAAYLCSHAYGHFEGGPPLLGIPAMASAISPYARNPDDAWRLAVFAGLTGVTGPRARPLSIVTVDGLRRGSAIREVENRRHGRE